MNRFIQRLKSGLAALAIAAAVAGAMPFSAQAAPAINTNSQGVAVHGYDPVAYFFDGTAMAGSAQHRADWKGVTFYFASDFNRTAFMSDPEYFLTQFDGFCAFGATMGERLDINPESWAMVEGSVYLFNNGRVRDMWLNDPQGNIARGRENWPSDS